MHGLGATAGLVLLSVAGDGCEMAGGGGSDGRATGLGAIGGGQALLAARSFGLGANGGFFTPAHRGGNVRDTHIDSRFLEDRLCSSGRNSLSQGI